MVIICILFYLLGNYSIIASSDTAVAIASEWTLVMKFARGQDIGGAMNLHDLWTGSYTVNEGNEEAMSLTTGSETYKSLIVDDWDDYNLTAVRVSFLTDGTEKAFVVFDAHGSNKKSWFNKSRILFSSWNDLNPQSTTNYDSIDGDQYTTRRFYMNRGNEGCIGDNGWFAVLDTPSGKKCDWEKNISNPSILYSDETGYEESYKQAIADVFAIWVYGGFSSWSSYGNCSQPCGNGTKTRTRTCNNLIPAENRSACVGNTIETAPCNSHPCQAACPSPSESLLCSCQNHVVNITTEKLIEIVNTLKLELKIDKTKTSLTIRRKTSANDSRISARMLGAVGAVILATPFVLIALSDLSTFYRFISTKTDRRRTVSQV